MAKDGLRGVRTLIALLVTANAVGAQERRWDDERLAPVGDALAAYIEARAAGRDPGDGRVALLEALAELPGESAAAPLSASADLGRALWLSRGYGREKLRAGRIESDEFVGGSFGEGGLDYAYRLPKDYDPRESSYPLLLTLPDVGERPADHLRTHWLLRDLLDGVILVCPAMPADEGEWARVMIDGRPGGLIHVLTALRVAGERFALDFDRVYVAGRGKGVPAAVAAGNYSPQRFAGVIGRAGDAGELGPENFGNLPTFFAGGGAKVTAFHAAAEAAGLDNCRVQPAAKELDLWNWIQGHARVTYPASVTVVPGDPFPTRAYWLRVAPMAPDARVTGSIDRAANTVRIDGDGVSQVVLYLNDALVDLNAPLTVACNGVERVALPRPDLADTLDLIHDGTSDPGCVYVLEALFDMSGEPDATAGDERAEDGDYAERRTTARGDVAALWELYQWCLANQREGRGPSVLGELVRLDPDHAEARAALGHERLGEHWFSAAAARARFEASQDPATAEAKGRVQHKGLWLHPDERSLASKGWRKDPETGQWLTAAERKKLAAGWARQDLEWIAPEQTQRLDDGLYRVNGEWLELERANRRRARVDSMWRLPGAEVTLYSTADREVSLRARTHMVRALEDLRRVFGAEPVLPLPIALLRDEEQYDRFAFGDPDGRRPATHAGRLHVLHSGFLAESWFPAVDGEREFRGMGVCYWDPLVPYGDLYGVHSARLAAGLSYVDRLDPSPKAVRKALKDGPEAGYYEAYFAEKQLPGWLRYGGAVYAERFFHDETVAADGDPWWARAWSLGNLEQSGGLRPLSEVLAFNLDPDQRDDGRKLLIEAGLVVAFIVDGECAPVDEAHAALKRAIATGRLHANHIEALVGALAESEESLRAFAGL
jgi:hypothetical protein